MSKRLSDQDIEKAVRLLDAWTGKLTWERYLAVLATELGQTYTKAGLRKQPRILNAWEMTRKRLDDSVEAAGARSNGDAAIVHARETITRLRNENERLRQENQDLLERFLRWSYNAVTERGMTPEQLDREIVVPRRPAERRAK
ncbi:MAG: hypothetical protein E5V64_29245 [Mesorhizobium sp.]|uniref:hypothetical protein n=1 Tax=unclassified Mesorhizobium TaxID=325217 RepID=UPI001093CB54|nr:MULTISPECIES: hypothetical protein [unclassified Mesorhizobium]TGS85093.1 hypothetical protein EN818_21730 [Mesorhizobium sp. M3A.F.Ca.ET.175.01.1.1]TGT23081.1 hypothetical protein EN817_23645 [Mesorhizobium sp. M3A.F.Ca.ET.174.01.1.1]TIV77830.1 MAG: hypothetical protein E5V64_29245 [Mesorhizobium sp.]